MRLATLPLPSIYTLLSLVTKDSESGSRRDVFLTKNEEPGRVASEQKNSFFKDRGHEIGPRIWAWVSAKDGSPQPLTGSLEQDSESLETSTNLLDHRRPKKEPDASVGTKNRSSRRTVLHL